jgi:cell wall-associated NlpC family hydrolase
MRTFLTGRNFCRAFLIACLCLLALPSLTAEAFYRSGDQGDAVKEIQVKLRKLGFSTNEPDGVFGAKTVEAVKAFQAKAGLTADGIVGVETYKKLMERDMPASRSGVANLLRRIISTAYSYEGVPYYFGGTTPDGFDCSGYVRFVFAQAGIWLPRMADEQYEVGRPIARADLQVGDLVYFETYTEGISHVGIYVGGGNFISATSSAGIAVRSLYNEYWGPRYLAATRML